MRCWNENYNSAPGDGSARITGDCRRRVLRGGGWTDNPWNLRSTGRDRSPIAGRDNYSGFRIARTQ